MRKAILIAVGVLLLVAVNWSIYTRERLLVDGRVVLLELAPVDPRSLMQGDYMALRFQVANDIRSRSASELPVDGYAVVKFDERRVGSFARFDDGRPLAADEAKMRYRVRERQVKFATNAYF